MIAGAAADASPTEDTSPFIEFGDDDDDDFDVDEARRKQDEEFDFGAMMKQSAADSKQKESLQGLSLSLSQSLSLLSAVINSWLQTLQHCVVSYELQHQLFMDKVIRFDDKFGWLAIARKGCYCSRV